jgi:hypothetical protein
MALFFQEISIILPLFLIIFYFYRNERLHSASKIFLPYILVVGVYFIFRVAVNPIFDSWDIHLKFLGINAYNFLPSMGQLIMWYVENLFYPHSLVLIWRANPVNANLILLDVVWASIIFGLGSKNCLNH